MTKDVEITLKIPAELVEEIDNALNSKALRAMGYVRENGSYQAFLLQAIRSELYSLELCLG